MRIICIELKNDNYFPKLSEVIPNYYEGHDIVNDHRESGPRFNVSSERWGHYSVMLISIIDCHDKKVIFYACNSLSLAVPYENGFTKVTVFNYL